MLFDLGLFFLIAELHVLLMVGPSNTSNPTNISFSVQQHLNN